MIAGEVETLITARNEAAAVFTQFREQVVAMGEGTVQAVESMAQAGRHLEGFFRTLGEAGFAIFGVTEGVKMLGDAAGIGRVTELEHAVHGLMVSTGQTAEEASKLLYAFQRYGVEAEQAETLIKRFSLHIHGLTDETDAQIAAGKGFAATMNEVGISFVTAEGRARPMADILGDLADRFQQMPDGIQKNALALQLFGRGAGPELTIMLNQGRAGMQESMEAAEKYGITLTSTTLPKVHEFVIAQRDLAAASSGLSIQIGTALVPALTNFDVGLAAILEHRGQVIGYLDDITDHLDTTRSGMEAAYAAASLLKGALGFGFSGGGQGVGGGGGGGGGGFDAQGADAMAAADNGARQALDELTASMEKAVPFSAQLAGQYKALAAELANIPKYAAEAQAAQAAALDDPRNNEGARRRYGLTGQETEAERMAIQGQRQAAILERRREDETNARDWEIYTRRAAEITAQNERERIREERRAADDEFRAHITGEQAGVGTQAVAQRVEEYAATQQQLQVERALHDVERQRQRDQQAGNRVAVEQDARAIQQLQGHLAYLKDIQANERELFDVQQAVVNARIALEQAERDGNRAQVDALRAQIAEWETLIGKIKAAGAAITEGQADATGQGAGASYAVAGPLGRRPGRHTTDDPYGIYGPGAASPPPATINPLSGRPFGGGGGHTVHQTINIGTVNGADEGDMQAWAAHIVNTTLDALDQGQAMADAGLPAPTPYA